jgi:hypothetical protein
MPEAVSPEAPRTKLAYLHEVLGDLALSLEAMAADLAPMQTLRRQMGELGAGPILSGIIRSYDEENANEEPFQVTHMTPGNEKRSINIFTGQLVVLSSVPEDPTPAGRYIMLTNDYSSRLDKSKDHGEWAQLPVRKNGGFLVSSKGFTIRRAEGEASIVDAQPITDAPTATLILAGLVRRLETRIRLHTENTRRRF